MSLSLLLVAMVAGPLSTSEVARHDSPEDCWMILNGGVYDMTGFIKAHPGGDAITRGCGKDATYFWEHRDDAGGHSEAAKGLLESYHLGDLGDVTAQELEEPAVPASTRLAGTRLGNQATADVGPSKSLALRISHNISTDNTLPSGIGIQAGYSTGRVDIMVSDEQSAGVGSLELKASLLAQHGERPRALSLAWVGGAGMGYRAGAPALYTQLIGQRDLLDTRLILRANGTAALAPGVEDSGRVSVGGSVEFRPMPLHGVFASVQSPLSAPGSISWNAGLSFYTRQHSFALYASSTPSLHPFALAGEVDQALSIGLSLERAFLLGG